jgi:hypothetical protein
LPTEALITGQRLGDLGGQSLLNLKTSGEGVDHPAQLAQAHDPTAWQVGDVGPAVDGPLMTASAPLARTRLRHAR